MKNVKTQTAERIIETPSEPEFEGLCMTCEHAPDCTYRKAANRAVQQCEEFESDLPKQDKRGHLSLVGSKEKPDVEPKEENRFKGLCINCENRETCVFPKPEEGVWRCEEYE